jgi:TolA-binding protein
MTDDPRLTPEDELPSELAQMLRKERDAAGPSSDVAERVLGRLEQTLGLPPMGGGAPGGSVPASHGAATAGTAGTAAAVAGISKAAATAAVGVALGLGAALGAAGHAALAPQPAPSVEVRTIVSVVRVVEAPSALPVPALPAPSGAASEATPSAKPKAAGVSSNLAARDRALAEENALIARAQAALARGNVAQARAALQEHASRFPNGQLQEERRLLERYTAAPKQGTP